MDSPGWQRILEGTLGQAREGRLACAVFDTPDPTFLLQGLRDRPAPERWLTARLQPGPASEPYDPLPRLFRAWAQEAGLSWAQLKKQLRPNWLHVPLWESLFTRSPGGRSEEIQREQIFYDRQELYLSLIRALQALAATGITGLGLGSLENLGPGLLDFLGKLLDHPHDLPLALILTLNSRPETPDRSPHLSGLRERLQNAQVLLFPGPLKGAGTQDAAEPEALASESPGHDLPGPALGLLQARRLRDWMDFTGADEVLRGLPGPNDDPEILEARGEIYYLSDRTDEAIACFERLLELAAAGTDKPRMASAYRRLSLAFYIKGNIDMAQKLLALSLKIAGELQDEPALFQARIAAFLVLYGYAGHKDMDHLVRHFDRFLETGRRLGAWLVSARACGQLVSDSSLVARGLITDQQRNEWCDEGLRIARRIGNAHLLASLYHNKGIILSSLHREDEAFWYYRRSELLKRRIGQKKEIVAIYNGTGYAHALSGRYDRALRYYRRSLALLMTIQDHIEICLTLFNIGELYFFAGRDEAALIFFNNLQKILQTLEIEKIPFHSLAEVYAMKGLVCLNLDKPLLALELRERARRLSRDFNSRDRLFQELLESALAFRDGHPALLEGLARRILDLPPATDTDRLKPRVLTELSRAWRRRGDEDKARAWEARRRQLPPELQPLAEPEASAIPVIRVDFFALHQIIHAQTAVNKLHRKIDDINFLNSLQNRLLRPRNTRAELLDDLLGLIYDLFTADEVDLFQKDLGAWSVWPGRAAPEGRLEALLACWPEPSETWVPRLADHPDWALAFPDLQSLILLPLNSPGGFQGLLLLGTAQGSLAFSEDEYHVMAIAGRQINAALAHGDLLEHLKQSNRELNQTLMQLVESEKMASLGALVAGIAHEINTPVGIGVTAASDLRSHALTTLAQYRAGQLSKSLFETFLARVDEETLLLETHLLKAGDLIRSFKKIAVDQSHEESRLFKLGPYLQDIIRSLHPHLKPGGHRCELDCPEGLELWGPPGTLVQILNNLIHNSVIHGFEGRRGGLITLTCRDLGSRVRLEYRDDGRGIPPEHLPRIFDPFFTSKRNQGGTGLGMSIVYNLVTQTWKGSVKADSPPGEGVLFTLELEKARPGH